MYMQFVLSQNSFTRRKFPTKSFHVTQKKSLKRGHNMFLCCLLWTAELGIQWLSEVKNVQSLFQS